MYDSSMFFFSEKSGRSVYLKFGVSKKLAFEGDVFFFQGLEVASTRLHPQPVAFMLSPIKSGISAIKHLSTSLTLAKQDSIPSI